MSPERKTTIGSVLIEEFYWGGSMVVYIDHYATDESFDEAVDRITKEQTQPAPAKAAREGGAQT